MFIFPSTIPTAGYQPAGALLFDGSADYLSLTPSTSPSDADQYSLSFWIKRCRSGTAECIIHSNPNTDGSDYELIKFNNDDLEYQFNNNSSGSDLGFNANTSTILHRDPTGWFHVIARRNSAVVELIVNGVSIYDVDDASASTQAGHFNDSSGVIEIGRQTYGGASITNYFQGYLADVVFLDGVFLDPTDIGEFDSTTGIWVPKDPSGLTFGNNGFWLGFSAPSFATYGVGKDLSGEDNHFTPTSMGTNNIIPDGPVNSTTKEVIRYSCLDPITQTGGTLTGNNLTYDVGAGGNFIMGNIAVSSGKWYWEYILTKTGFTGGIADPSLVGTTINNGFATKGAGFSASDGDYGYMKINNAAWNAGDGFYSTNGTTRPSAGSRMQVFLNLDDNEIQFGNNNNTGTAAQSITAGTYVPIFGRNAGNTEDDGTAVFAEADWTYSAPAGYSELTETITGVGNYPTFDPNFAYYNNDGAFTPGTLSEGNMVHVRTGSLAYVCPSTFGVPAGNGRWWIEFEVLGFNDQMQFGVMQSPTPFGSIGASASSWGPTTSSTAMVRDATNTRITKNGSTVDASITAVVATGKVFSLDLNTAAGTAVWYENGVVISVDTDVTGLNTTGGSYVFYHQASNAGAYVRVRTHNLLFPGARPAAANLWNTSHFPEPTVTDPSAHFDTLLWTGTGSAKNETGLADAGGTAWTPDFVWIKERDGASDHALFDCLRSNGTRALRPSGSGAQDTDATAVTDLISGGVALGDNSGGYNSTNTNTKLYVAWCMKAGGEPTADNSGGINPTSGSRMKGGSAITTAYASANIYPVKMSTAAHGGFSIFTYTGTGTAGHTVPHGLDAAPSCVIIKDITDSNNDSWQVGFDGMTSYDYALTLNANNAQDNSANWWNDTAPSSTLITLGDVARSNDSGETHVCYAFAKTSGLIGVGSYTGNQLASGPVVPVDDGGSGFKPAWLMIKESDAAGSNWHMYDNKRRTYNTNTVDLNADIANAESYNAAAIDFLSNSFKIRNSGTGINEQGKNYIYLAFAEMPFGLNNRAK